MKRVVWICGLPNDVRLHGASNLLSPVPTPAWSWIIGHLPPPPNVDLHIVCPVHKMGTRYQNFNYLGATWHCFNRKKFYHVFSYVLHFVRVGKLINKLQPDIVHGWGGETGFGYLATKICRNAVVSVQGILMYYCQLSQLFTESMRSIYGKYMLWREHRTYNGARMLLVESNTSEDALKRYYGLRSIVVPHPLRKVFYTPVKRDDLRKKPPVFLFLGTLEERKGALDAVKAFAKISNADARLVIVGKGNCMTRMQQVVAYYKMNLRVAFKGSCSAEEIVSIMRSAHFYLLPSYGDTGPTSLKEAIACGLFPICYDNSGPHEYVMRYGCGYLCETGKIDALSKLMDKAILEMNLSIEKGIKAAARIQGDLSPSAIWERLISVYDEIEGRR